MSSSALKNSIGHNIRILSYNNWALLQKLSDLKAEKLELEYRSVHTDRDLNTPYGPHYI